LLAELALSHLSSYFEIRLREVSSHTAIPLGPGDYVIDYRSD